MSGMKEEHQRIIQTNITTLIEKCKVGPLLDKLAQKNVFPSNMIDAFQRNSDGARKLFIEVQRRGPTAFEHLVMGLLETNQIELVKLLDPTHECISERPHGGAHPFMMPKESDDVYNLMNSDTPVEIRVVRSTNFNHDEPRDNKAPVYYTRSKTRGVVKIINVYNVVDYKPRRGSLNDVKSLKQLFSQIGMEVEASEYDLTAQDIKDDLRAFVNNRKLKNMDIVILVIMSHGGINVYNEEFFYGCDAVPVYTKYVEALFNNSGCKYMQGKPKIILYQVCRGELHDYGVARHVVETDGGPKSQLPHCSDLLVINSTLREHKTHRDVHVGAWYIQILCYVFMNHCHNMDIETMLKLIQVNIHTHRSADNTMQTPEFVNRAFQLCYLNPGIYMENNVLKHF